MQTDRLGRARTIAIIAINVLVLPITVGVALWLLVSLFVFVMRIDVTNASGETVRLTPVGRIGGDRPRVLLPAYHSMSPAFPRLPYEDFELGPGESHTFLYDMDDVQFSELIVRRADGELLQLVVDRTTVVPPFRAPLVNNVTIPPLPTLQTAEPKVSAPLATPPRRAWLPPPRLFWLGLLTSLLVHGATVVGVGRRLLRRVSGPVDAGSGAVEPV